MISLLNEIFNPKHGGIYSWVLIISISVLFIIITLNTFIISEIDIQNQNERNMIEVMECNKLGSLILNQEISYYNEDFALDHWIIRCK